MPCSRSPEGWYPSMPCRFPGPQPGRIVEWSGWGVSRPTPKGEVVGSALGGVQAHTWGGCPVPHLGEVQAHTWGGVQAHTWSVSRPTPGGSPGPHPGGSPGPHPGGVSQHALRQTPPDSYCCGWYTSYRNAFLLILFPHDVPRCKQFIMV